jgi:hypothetical protein
VGAAGALALGAGIGRYRAAGLDGEVAAMLAIGGVLALLPMAWPALAGLSPLAMTAAAAVAMFGAAALWAAVRDNPSLAGLGERQEVVGRAAVVAGDLLKVDGTTVRLSASRRRSASSAAATTSGAVPRRRSRRYGRSSAAVPCAAG